MTFKEAYKFPLKVDGGFVFTDDDRLAFDFACCFDRRSPIKAIEMLEIVSSINGGIEKKMEGLSYNGDYSTIYLGDKELIVIRGWGHLTGTGGLRLSEEQAEKIQDDFAEFIIKQLA